MGVVLAGWPEIARAQIGRSLARFNARVETKDVRAGSAVQLALTVTLAQGFHVQSNAPRDPSLIPTLLTLLPPAGVTVDEIVFPAASDFKQTGMPQPLAVFSSEFTIAVRVTLAPGVPVGELIVPGHLRYQACDDRACYPPTTASVSWKLVVTGPAGASVPPAVAAPPGSAAPTPAASASTEAAGTPRTIVAMVRSAMAEDFARAERLVENYRAARGVMPEMLLAKSWLGRGALAAGRLEVAEAHARATYDLGRAELERRTMDQEDIFPIAFGAAIEVLGQAAARQGRRSEAVAFLRGELQTYGATSLHKRIQKNLNLLSLEGTVAPELDRSEPLGGPVPSLAELRGKVVLLFFWAHWCSDCKAQGPMIESLLRQYGSRGFTVVAPTQRFGYAVEGKPAPAADEDRYIADVRRQYYGWMASVPVTLSASNHERYGVSTTPTLVLLDRRGVVRLYRPGLMPEAELDELVRRLLDQPTAP